MMNSSIIKLFLNVLKQRAGRIKPIKSKTIQHSRVYSTQTDNLPVMTLYTKDNCQLCDEAKIQLIPLSHRFKLEEVDITLPENKEWFNKYRYDIPVFHFEGKFLMKHKVNIKLCEKTLTDFEELRNPTLKEI